MIVELSTGYIVPGAQSPAFRNTVSASSAPKPAQVLARDAQGLAPAGRLGIALGAMKGAERGIDAAQGLAAAALTGVEAIAAALADMKVLSEAAAETTVSNTDRAILNAAFGALRDEISAIVDRTTYDGVKLLDGDGGASRSFTFTVGASASSGAAATVTIGAATAAGLASGLETASLLTAAGAAGSDALVDTAIEAADGMAAALHAAAGRAAAAADVNGHAGAGTSAVRDGFLEYRSLVDQTRQNAITISAEADLALAARDAAIASGGAISTLVASLPEAGGRTDGAPERDQAAAPKPRADTSSASEKKPATSSAVDITA